MAVGDVYELTLTQLDRGQTVNNIFFYKQDLSFVTTNPTIAQALAEGWTAQILPAVLDVQPAEVLTTEVKVRNLYNVSDGYTLSLSESGSFTTDRELESTFNAYGFKLNGDNPAVKNGAKRFGGVFEDYINDGVVTGATLIAVLDDLGDAIASPVDIGMILTDPVFLPVLVKRVRTGSPGAYEYRLPENSGEAVLSQIVVALWNAVITSQISRKIGVGI